MCCFDLLGTSTDTFSESLLGRVGGSLPTQVVKLEVGQSHDLFRACGCQAGDEARLSRSQEIRSLFSMVCRALYRANNSAFHTKGTTVDSSVLSKEERGVRYFLDSGKALDE